MERLNFLSQDEVKGIHEATLRILSEVGYVWTHKESLEILTGAGCTVKGNRVYFPPELVEESIKKAGKKVSVKGRGGMVKNLGDGNLYFHNLGGARCVRRQNQYAPHCPNAGCARRHTRFGCARKLSHHHAVLYATGCAG